MTTNSPSLRKLGNSDLQVSPIALGGNVFGWTADEATSFRILDAFIDSGFNLIDTADIYTKWIPGHTGGESETVIGKWLKTSGKRNKAIIASKVGFDMNPADPKNNFNLKKSYILKSVDDSLKRLQIDVIDLYQTHIDDPSTPIEETMEALHTLVKQGKVRALGASQIPPERIHQSQTYAQKNNLTPYTCLQPGYNLCMRENYEKELQSVAKEYNLGVITYFSLAAGFLTGKYKSTDDLGKSPRGNGIIKSEFLNEKGLKIIKALETLSRDLNEPIPSIALAWILANPTVTAPIASASKFDQLKDILRAPHIKLDNSSLSLLNEVSK